MCTYVLYDRCYALHMVLGLIRELQAPQVIMGHIRFVTLERSIKTVRQRTKERLEASNEKGMIANAEVYKIQVPMV